MATDLPPQGSVVAYPYLWRSQRASGETEGRKRRPVCLVLRMRNEETGLHHLVLLAISSQPPRDDQRAIEIPDTERRRAGLTRYPRAWIVVSEYNYDVLEQSFYYEPQMQPLGMLSAAFRREVAAALRPTLAQRQARIDRTS